MNKFRLTINALAVVVFTLAFASLAQAQATRTWVSGVGDDVNPCSRTAPCKTFAGAISKTAKDGEISVLDPGGYGAVTITKSITLNGTHGAGHGSILSAGAANGVLINITDVNDIRKTVRLVSININGASTGTNGIRVLSALKVYVEDCVLDGFTNRGIDDNRSTPSGKLVVKDTVVRGTVQSGIVVIPSGAGSMNVIMENVSATGSTSNGGYAQSGNVKSSLTNCIFSGNSSNGVFADGSGGEVTVENCIIASNGTGISVAAPAVVRLNATVIHNNTTNSISGASQVSSTGTNTITGNGGGNVLPAGPPIGQT